MEPNKTFIIQHKVTKEKWVANSGKSSWAKIGSAKNAFNCTTGVKFRDQVNYEIIELTPKSGEQLKKALLLLQSVVDENAYDGIASGLRMKIHKFLKEVNDVEG